MRYKFLDPRLSSQPGREYENFPGWRVFLGTTWYSTWQEASKVAIAAGMRSGREYCLRRREVDPKLPGHPNKQYSDFPGWKIFLRTARYPTWQEASAVAIAAGIKTRLEYQAKYRSLDPRLTSLLERDFEDFPGWEVFLGKKQTRKRRKKTTEK